MIREVDDVFNEKIIYYRKRNMLTQEELAEKLNVSRQTITKWENGIIYPNLEYLIDLSNLFGVTVDSLVKDDDCTFEKHNKNDNDTLIKFIAKAKRSTYASQQNKIESTRDASHDYMYKDDEYTYYDSFFGASSFSGQEIVYKNNNVCWSMNYYGYTKSPYFNGDFLREALLNIVENQLLRGPELYKRGEYTYISNATGDMSLFNGIEQIYYRNKKIYECMYHGGICV